MGSVVDILNRDREHSALTDAVRISLAYVAVAGLWITLSDQLVASATSDPKLISLLQTYKGWFFVLVTGMLLMGLVYRAVVRATVSRDAYRTLFDLDGVSHVLLDENLRIQRVNYAFSRLLGLPRTRLEGRPLADFLSDAEQLRLATLLRSTVGTPEGSSRELRLRNAAGKEMELELASASLAEGGGRLVSLVDRTHARALERQLAQLDRMDAVGRLAAGVAHDFNNLLTAIRGYATLLAENLPAGHPQQPDVAEIIAATDRAAGLTGQILTFARGLPASAGPSVFDSMAREAESLLDRVAGGRVELQFDLAAGSAAVPVDQGQLEQVLLNLTVNARDAMPDGGVIRISSSLVEVDDAFCALEPDLLPGMHLRLRVEDTGTGIADEHVPHIFEPFFTTRPVGAGTGLGLATVYGIVRQAGGAIAVDGRPGRGAVFDVYLPRVELPGAPEPAGTKAQAMADAAGEWVVLADDDRVLRRLTSRILERLGYRVTALESAEVARSLLTAPGDTPDLWILDLVLGDMTGTDLAREIRDREPDVPILFVSGYADQPGLEDWLNRRQAAFLAKPYSATELSRALRGLLAPVSAADGEPNRP